MSSEMGDGPPESRPTLRERRAQLTRDEILRAARGLFAERGYARTSVRDIAQAAGVSAQTVYDSVGPKPQLVVRLNDLIDAEAGVAAIARAAAESDDPREVAAISARVTRSILERCGDIIHALVSGAAAEPALAAALADGQRRHLDGAARVVAMLQQLGALDRALDPSAAAETLAALSDVRLALVLHESYGWPLDRVERWIADTSRTLLLTDAARPAGKRAARPSADRSSGGRAS
jgi:AcrR family transcriptional regulator